MNSTVATSVTEIVLPGTVEPDGLELRTRDLPAPAEGQVVLPMDATGVSFAEQQMRRGAYYDQPPFPFVPGYDLVGTVTAVGPEAHAALVGHRFAAVTKTGAWTSHLLIDAADLMPVPDEVDAAAAETVLVNGITAWQMLHRVAKVRTGGTIVVLGANGGVGSTLAQLARHAGITVIGTTSARHHATVRAPCTTPVDYRDPHMYDRIRELAPDGVDAVFDHVGGAGIEQSWQLLRRGGVLVSYGSAATKDNEGDSQLPVLKLFARLTALELPAPRQERTVLQLLGRQAPLPHVLAAADERGPHPGAAPGGRRRPHPADRREDPVAGRRLGTDARRVPHRRRQDHHRP